MGAAANLPEALAYRELPSFRKEVHSRVRTIVLADLAIITELSCSYMIKVVILTSVETEVCSTSLDGQARYVFIVKRLGWASWQGCLQSGESTVYCFDEVGCVGSRCQPVWWSSSQVSTVSKLTEQQNPWFLTSLIKGLMTQELPLIRNAITSRLIWSCVKSGRIIDENWWSRRQDFGRWSAGASQFLNNWNPDRRGSVTRHNFMNVPMYRSAKKKDN